MSNGTKRASGFDIQKSMNVFFDKKSTIGAIKERKDMYEVLIKMVAEQMIEESSMGSDENKDNKLQIY